MKTQKIIICLALLLGCFLQKTQSIAQQNELEIVESVRLDGPRLGFTYIGEGKHAEFLEEELSVKPFITQFGWQFETSFFTLPSGTSGLVEGVLLFGGIEQNVVLPSGTFLIGLRGSKGAEFGFGPSLSLSGVAFVFAAGVTFKSNHVNFPINVAVEPSPKGVKLSLLIGFNSRRW